MTPSASSLVSDSEASFRAPGGAADRAGGGAWAGRCQIERLEPEAYQDFLAECLGQAFEVSPEAAARRLKKWNELNRQ